MPEVKPAQPVNTPPTPNPTPTQKNAEPKAKSVDGVTVTPVEGGVPGREFRGVCDVCGWQTHQQTVALATDAVKDHAKKHKKQ